MRRSRTTRREPLPVRRDRQVLACAVLAACLAPGCRLHAVDESPAPVVPAGQGYSLPVDGVDPNQRWWRALADPRLTDLIEASFSGNLTLQRARLRIEQAAALRRQAAVRLLPALDAGASAEREWPDKGVKHTDSLGGTLRLSWELDLWGRLASAYEASELDTAAVREDLQATALLLSAEVAETYLQVIEQRLQLALLGEQIEAGKTLLGLIQLRFGQGQASVVDVYQQQQQLAATRAQLPQIRSRLVVLENRLKVLVGRSPTGKGLAVSPVLPRLPAVPAPGVPSDLLVNRPDLRRIRCELLAADHRVAEAVADRLPRLTVGLDRYYTGTDFRRLTPEGLFTSLMGDLAGPVIDWGGREAEVRRRRALVRERLLALSQAYLTAIEEVENALWQERRERELIAALDKELAIARRNLKETRARYSQGLTDYLPVLAAVQSLQALERNVLTRRRELVSIRVLLYRALGGAGAWLADDDGAKGKAKPAPTAEGDSQP